MSSVKEGGGEYTIRDDKEVYQSVESFTAIRKNRVLFYHHVVRMRLLRKDIE